MAYNQLITKSGHSLFTMSSLYQKAIRRCDVKAAGYAANELFDRYEHYLWKRTLVISAEDCYGECTQEILALYWASQEVNKGKKGPDKDFHSKGNYHFAVPRKEQRFRFLCM